MIPKSSWIKQFIPALLTILLLPQPLRSADTVTYHDYESMTELLQSLAKNYSGVISLEKQAETLGKRNIWRLTLSDGKTEQYPAILILGGVSGSDLFGSELCLQFTQTLAAAYGKADSVTQLLKNTTFYIFPRVTPDASEAFFQTLKYERTLNNRAVDLDKDGSQDEDGYDDLNNDGLITMMRVTDPAGDWLTDSKIPQLLRQADRARGEKGVYRLYTEGLDNDGDGQWNEDEPGGVDFNRNFSYRYKYFSRGSGNYPMSEIESSTIAEFLFSHQNIACVFCFSPGDNLNHPWQAEKDGQTSGGNAASPPEKPLTGVRPGDEPYFRQISEQFKSITGFADAPESKKGEGSFNEWAYYHYGRWSFSSPSWWPPLPDQPADSVQADSSAQRSKSQKEESGEKDKNDMQMRLWKWIEKTGQPDAFVPWKEVSHPDFPDEKVEVGGFAPYTGINPPIDSLALRAKKFNAFLLNLSSRLPRIAIDKVNVTALHDNLFRVQVFVTNSGFFPTNTDLGIYSKWNPKVKLSLIPDKGQKLIDNKEFHLIDTIDGSGGTQDYSWVILGKKGGRLTVRVDCPMAGHDEKIIDLK